jgi:tetratricopeptide (TPR) repeat protein
MFAHLYLKEDYENSKEMIRIIKNTRVGSIVSSAGSQRLREWSFQQISRLIFRIILIPLHGKGGHKMLGKILGLISMTLAIVVATPIICLSQVNPDIPLAKAREYQERGKIEKALALYDKALEVNPQDFNALWASARLLYQQASYQEALNRFQAMTAYYPKDTPARIYLGLSKLKTGRADSARSDFQEALESNPDSAAALMGLGQAELELGNRFTANQYFKRALALKPDDEKLKSTIARLREENEQYLEQAEKARQEFLANRLNRAMSARNQRTITPPGRSRAARRTAEAQILYDIIGMGPPVDRSLDKTGARGQSGKSRLRSQ